MWDEIYRKLSSDDKIKVNLKDYKVFMGEGNKNAEIIILLDSVDDDIDNNISLLKSKKFEQIYKILQFSKIDIDRCYFTCLIKSKVREINDDLRRAYMKYLVEEIYLVNPKYIISIGEGLFNFIYRYYMNDYNLSYVDIRKVIGLPYDFYNIGLLPIPDIEYIKRLPNDNKKILYDSIKELNK